MKLVVEQAVGLVVGKDNQRNDMVSDHVVSLRPPQGLLL